MSEHSPTPWRTRPFDERDFAYLYDSRNLAICLDHYETEHNRATVSRADAEHIVKCVNLHDNLVKALEARLDELSHFYDDEFSRSKPEIAKIQAADRLLLAKAKGEA